ncbi:hypothetical protein [Massilia sp. CT11-137]|uniref:hypothetical protein n=1 Tax=Massilia sp. CT11-137 TaxID=3393901 RepID=UPI0039A51426
MMAMLAKTILLAVPLSLATHALCAGAKENPCEGAEKKLNYSFQDLDGKISPQDKVHFDLLSACIKRNSLCAIVDDSASHKPVLVEGSTSKNLKPPGLAKRPAFSAVRPVQTRDGHPAGVLARFSGGTASAWLVEAWETSHGKVRDLDAGNISLTGEVFTPDVLFQEMETAGRKLRHRK